MEKLKLKYNNLFDALEPLKDSINNFDEIVKPSKHALFLFVQNICRNYQLHRKLFLTLLLFLQNFYLCSLPSFLEKGYFFLSRVGVTLHQKITLGDTQIVAFNR